jgi:hypothetical protein
MIRIEAAFWGAAAYLCGSETGLWETTVKITSRSGQFRPKEVATLKKGQRHFKEPGMSNDPNADARTASILGGSPSRRGLTLTIKIHRKAK